MENYIGISIAIFATITILIIRSQVLLRLFLTATVSSMVLALSTGFDADNSLFLIRSSLLATLWLAFSVSFLPLNFRKIAAYAVGILTALPIGAVAVYQGFNIEWSIIHLGIVLIGSSIPLITQLKTAVASKFFEIETHFFTLAMQLVVLGVFLVFSIFLTGTFGLTLLAVGLFSTALVQRSFPFIQLSISLFALAWVLFVVYQLELDTNIVFKGNLWLGIFAGSGLALLCKSLLVGTKRYFNLSIFLPFVVLAVLVSFGFIHDAFGGINTVLGAILGSALVLPILPEAHDERIFPGVIIPLVLMGLTMPINQAFKPKALPVESLIQTDDKTSSKKEKINPLTLPAKIPNETDAGSWSSLAEFSKLSFELGPISSKTTGAITDFKSTLELNAAGQPMHLDVKMNMASLTTFNSMRDEEVLGSAFIQADKYKEASYTSTAIVQVGDNFEVDGELNFAGKKVAVPLLLRFISETEKAGKKVWVFVGESSVDRTKHNMKSDPKIGDVVAVSFEVAISR